MEDQMVLLLEDLVELAVVDKVVTLEVIREVQEPLIQAAVAAEVEVVLQLMVVMVVQV